MCRIPCCLSNHFFEFYSGNDECINGPCWNFGNIHHLTEAKPRLAKKSNDDCEEKEEKEGKYMVLS